MDNFVTHSSNLLLGKGWSPLTWQVLQGESSINISSFESVTGIDSVPINTRRKLQLSGYELLLDL